MLEWLKTILGDSYNDDIDKKVMYFFVVVVAHCIDVVTGADGVMRNLTIGFLIANEGISILENTTRCGVPWPQKLKNVLEQLKNNNDKTE